MCPTKLPAIGLAKQAETSPCVNMRMYRYLPTQGRIWRPARAEPARVGSPCPGAFPPLDQHPTRVGSQCAKHRRVAGAATRTDLDERADRTRTIARQENLPPFSHRRLKNGRGTFALNLFDLEIHGSRYVRHLRPPTNRS